MPRDLIKKMNEALMYAVPEQPPEYVSFRLGGNKLTETEITVQFNGKEYARNYKLKVRTAVELAAKRPKVHT